MIEFCLIFTLLFNPGFVEKPQKPTIIERLEFNGRLRILRNHSGLIPRKVDDVIRSFKDTVRVSYDCPGGSKFRKVYINVTTRHIKWDRNLSVGEEQFYIPGKTVGYYIWQPTILMKGKEKRIYANNFVMFTLETPGKQMSSTPLVDEAIFYHELLHGQLLLDAMKTKEWRKKVCDGDFDMGPSDSNHKRIPELVQNYLRSVAAITDHVYAVSILPQQASSTAYFEIQIGRTDILKNKKKWQTFTYYPSGSNVDPNSFTIQPKGTKVMASGKLIDKNQKGFVLVHFIESK
ncbi:hypothetical protein IID10_11935 [candidate division KSB1 bacterium]|nr:hypothetical protein [candidate division KSB1 bacterium]TDI88225.1 MAG: hypothetical protein E2O77_11730 [Caldithrix sp.]